MGAAKTNGGGKRIGYVRVSSADQDDARQLDGVTLDKIFTDKASGKDTNRLQLQAMLEFVREGDIIFVHSMDRLSRSLSDLEAIVTELTKRGVTVSFKHPAMTFTGEDSPMSMLMLQMLGAVGQFERALIRERQMEGIAIAKTKGDIQAILANNSGMARGAVQAIQAGPAHEGLIYFGRSYHRITVAAA